MNIRPFFSIPALLSVFILAACQSTSPADSRWRNIGTISNGNIRVAVDKSSIQKNGVLATFRDRKTVSDMKKERFANTPAYKTAIGSWEIHCTNKTYRLTALQLLDERNREISNQSYTATAIRPMGIMGGTITEKQYETVCGKKL